MGQFAWRPLTKPIPARRFLSWLLAGLIWWIGGTAALSLGAAPAQASLDNDHYDGNIFALYAGNGSLVPPQTTLADGLARKEVVVLVFYLDDNSSSKRFAPVVSELQRLWGNRIALVPLVTDPLQNRPVEGPSDPAHYWSGAIPQVVVIDHQGEVVFDHTGPVDLSALNTVVSNATGIPLAPGNGGGSIVSFNELNSEIRPDAR
jgi:hypothetical protein